MPQQQVIRDFGKSRAKALKDIKAGLPMRGRLVQQQQPGPPQQGADKGDALPLAARQLRGAVSDWGVQAVGQALDEGVELRPGQDVADVVVRRAGAAKIRFSCSVPASTGASCSTCPMADRSSDRDQLH